MAAVGLQEGCRLGDRASCDALEFEGIVGTPSRSGAGAWFGSRASGGSSGAAAAYWHPSAAELGFAVLPLLLLAIVTWMLGVRPGHRRGAPSSTGGAAAVDHVRSRRLAALAPEQRRGSNGGRQEEQAQNQDRAEAQPSAAAAAAPALPPHPAAAAAAPGDPAPASAGLPPLILGAGSTLLAAADTALSHLLVLPVSLLQHARYLHTSGRTGSGAAPAAAAAAAAPRTPQAAAISPGSQRAGGSAGGKVYGLGIGEAESEEEEWGGEESELTQACLRRLQQSAEFKAYLKARGLTTADVGAAARRLRLYRRLRRLDPAAFWQLLRPGSRTVFQSRAPSRLVLAVDYLLSSAANLAVAAAVYGLWRGSSAAVLPPAVAAAAAAGLLWMVAAQWLRARPTAGALFGLWYEEKRWGHAAPAWRSTAANLLEAAYILLSAGLGLAVSLCLRCLSARRQGVGEMLLAIHPVQEVAGGAPAEEEGCRDG
ncbi:hypothetical protein ABPG75_000333 [Micractinium tetrahymenae]